jgi:hypothetical protein
MFQEIDQAESWIKKQIEVKRKDKYIMKGMNILEKKRVHHLNLCYLKIMKN